MKSTFHQRTRALTEGAIFVALAFVLSLLTSLAGLPEVEKTQPPDDLPEYMGE